MGHDEPDLEFDSTRALSTVRCADCGFVQSSEVPFCRGCGNDLLGGAGPEAAPTSEGSHLDDLRSAVAWLTGADSRPDAALLAGASLAALVMLWLGTSFALSSPVRPTQQSPTFLHQILSSANLVFHEAGHWILGPFGRFIGILGGTIMEVLIPVVCTASFVRTRNRIGAAVSTWWCGQVLTGVAAYAADARAGRLVLLGGVTGADRPGYHDWNNILRQVGLLDADVAIGWTIHLVGASVMLLGVAWAIALAWHARGTGRENAP